MIKVGLNGDFIRVLFILNILIWYYINEKRDDKSFMGADIVSSP